MAASAQYFFTTLCILSSCSWITVVLSQDLPQITKQILPEIKRMGLTGMLECTVSRLKSVHKVSWIHTDTNNIISIDDEIDIDDKLNTIIDGWHKFAVSVVPNGDSKIFKLIIRRLQETDSGRYECRVNSKGAGGVDSVSIMKSGLLTVLVPPTISQSQTTQTKNVKEGDNVTLTCGATGFPKPNITWVRSSGKLLPPPVNLIRFRGEQLTLYNVNREARGVYRCVCDNAVRPPATYDATLYVDFKPYARHIQDSYGQAQNRMFSLTIECIVAGYPKPNVQWFKAGVKGREPINDNQKYDVQVYENHGETLSTSEYWLQLTIMNVQANDFGDYHCEGTNRRGTHYTIVNVYETSECQGANCPQEGSDNSGPPKAGAEVTRPVCLLTVILVSISSIIQLTRIM